MNIFNLPDLSSSNEVTNILIESEMVRIERIISTGQTSDWYDQDETEFVVLCAGNAELEFENGERLALARGDTLLIHPHQKHRVSYTSRTPPCVWLCVFY